MSTPIHLPVAPPGDCAPVSDLRRDDAHILLPQLNDELHIHMSAPVYERIRTYFATVLRRDPTVGELRLLEALDRHGRDTPVRTSPGQLTTRSAELAETWARMMRAHGALHGAGSARIGRKAVAAPPCSLSDALELAGRCSRYDGPLLLSAPYREAEASARGYAPVARLTADGVSYSLWTRSASLPVSAAHKGDLLLYLPRVTPRQIQAFLEEIAAKPHPISFDIRAVSCRSLLLTLWELCPGAELYADRLAGAAPDGRIPADILCAFPTVGADGVCDYLLRVPVKQIHRATAALQKQGVSPVSCGQVRGNDRTVIRVRDGRELWTPVAVDLPSAFLASMGAACLHAYEAEIDETPRPAPVAPMIARLPSPLYGENGLTPTNAEVVALTRCKDRILRIPEADVLLTVLSVTVTEPHTAYRAAASAVTKATDDLAAAGASPASMALSVTVTVPTCEAMARGEVMAAVCGVYRAATERGLPVTAPVIDVDPARGLTVRVAAYSHDREVCRACSSSDDRQWRTSGRPVHKESPAFLFPVVRRSYEDCLKALAAALNRDEGAAYAMCPVVMNVVEIDVPAESAAEENTPATEEIPAADIPAAVRKETRHVLHPASVARLVQRLGEWNTPVFCMSEEDTRTLLASADIAEALDRRIDMGYPVVVLGDACKPFAESGFLPEAVAAAETLPVGAVAATATASVTYAFPAEPSVRMLRAPLRALPSASADIPCLMTLRLPDGTAVSDGFIGREGKVLGILNGVDTTVLPLLRNSGFEI